MERTYESIAAFVGRATGPLASHLGPFVTSLIDQQYTANVIYIKARHALAFDRWLAKHRAVLADLGEVHIERYQRRGRGRWLGHESIETTQIYLDANLELKQRVLDAVTPPNGKPGRYRPDDKLLAFLKSL